MNLFNADGFHIAVTMANEKPVVVGDKAASKTMVATEESAPENVATSMHRAANECRKTSATPLPLKEISSRVAEDPEPSGRVLRDDTSDIALVVRWL